MNYDGQTVKAWAGNSQWRAWRADLARFRAQGFSGYGSEGFWAITIYRLQRAVLKSQFAIALLPVRVALAIIKKLFTCVTHISLDATADIGPGLFIPHVGLIRVHPEAKIGADCAIHQLVTIGAGTRPGAPTLEDHVMVGCHACILGPVVIGRGARIGAGAVVTSDIPAGATAVGVPAKAIQRRQPTKHQEHADQELSVAAGS